LIQRTTLLKEFSTGQLHTANNRPLHRFYRDILTLAVEILMRFFEIGRIVSLTIVLGLTGCAAVPYEQLKLDTTSSFRQPSAGKAGIYVYQWKSGMLGAGLDVNFEIKGQPKISLNTGEYGYFELAPGDYEYKLRGGLAQMSLPVKFEAGQNYFFRAALVNASDLSVLIRDQPEIDEAKSNILGGRYEWHTAD
jgi:Protein of unknown function (DUF2846)